MMDVIYMGNTLAGRQDPEPARCLPRQAHVSRRTHQAKINLSRKLELGVLESPPYLPVRDLASGCAQLLLSQAEQVLVDDSRERSHGQLALGERGDSLSQIGGEPGGT